MVSPSPPSLPCNQQSERLLFNSRWIVDDSTTRITLPTSNSIKISVSSEDSVYNIPGRRGTSPMILLVPIDNQQQCISGKIKITTNSSNKVPVSGGIILMDPSFSPLFECGIGNIFYGSTNDAFRIESSPTSPTMYMGSSPDTTITTIPYMDYYSQIKKVTIFSPYNSEISNYIYENLDEYNYTYFKLVIDRSTGILSFYDGYKTYNVTTQFTISYIGIYLKGEGQSTLDLEDLVYSGLGDAPPVAISQVNENDYTIIKNTSIDSYDSEIFTVKTSLEKCSNLCEVNNLQCTAFEFDDSINMCTLRSYVDVEKFYNSTSTGISSSPIPITSNVYIKGTNLPTISYFYMFKDSDENYTSLRLTPNLEIVNLCIDNTYSNDFMALDVDKIRVHSGIFEYDFIKNPNDDDTKGSLALKFITRQNEIFYIVSVNNSYFKEIKFVDNTKTNFIETAKKAVPLDLDLKKDFNIGPSTNTFDCISASPSSSTVKFFRNSSNSFTITNNILDHFINDGGPPISVRKPVIVSKSKIILSKNPLTALIICSDKMLFLLNDVSIFSTLSAGFLFSNSDSYPTSMPEAYEITYSTPLIPPYKIPFSQTFPEKFLDGEEYTFFYTASDTTYILRFVAGFVDYSAFGYTNRYVTRIIRNNSSSIRGVIFTDKTGITHFIYIDATTQHMYDKISDEIEFGPFSKTYPMHNIGDLFILSSSTGPVFRFLCATYDTIWIHAYPNPLDRDIFFLLQQPIDQGTKIGDINISTPTVFSDSNIEFMTSFNFMCTTTTTGTSIYTGDILEQSLKGFSINYSGSKIDVNQTTRLVFNTNNYNIFYKENSDRYLSDIIEFSPTTNTFKKYNPCSYDDFVSGNITVSSTGTYTYTLSMENFYDTEIIVNVNDRYIYSNDKPHLLLKRNDGSIYKRTLFQINTNTIIPNIKRIGHISVIGFTSTTIELSVDDSTLQNGDLVDFAVISFSDMSLPLTLVNPPTQWNTTWNTSGLYTLNLSSPMLKYGVYLVRCFSRGTFVIDSTGGYFELVDDSPVAQSEMTYNTIPLINIVGKLFTGIFTGTTSTISLNFISSNQVIFTTSRSSTVTYTITNNHQSLTGTIIVLSSGQLLKYISSKTLEYYLSIPSSPPQKIATLSSN